MTEKCLNRRIQLFENDVTQHIRYFCMVTILFFLLIPAYSQKAVPVKHLSPGECDNFVKIEGSTNVNRFEFLQQIPEKSKEDKPLPDHARLLTIQIPAHNFSASNPLMYNDFLKLIQAENHPIITILIYYNPGEFINNEDNQITSKIEVKLAGQQRSYTIPGKLVICKNRLLRVQGSVRLKLEDFNLEPPTKFFGMVKVNQEIFVNFGLTMDNLLLTKN